MEIYTSVQEAVADLKAKTGRAMVRYFINGREVPAGAWRTAEGEPLIYRSGLEIHAEK